MFACKCPRWCYKSQVLSYRLLQMLVIWRYLLMFGVKPQLGKLIWAEQPVISASLSRSSLESKSEKWERHIWLIHGVCTRLSTLYIQPLIIAFKRSAMPMLRNRNPLKKKICHKQQCELCVCCLCVLSLLNAACLTCCIERTFVHMMRPFLQQTEGLRHVVCRSDSDARLPPRLLH